MNDVFPGLTEVIKFQDCTISGNLDYFFAGLPFLRDIDFTGLRTSDLTSMRGTFFDRGSFITEKMTEIDMSIFDTSRVTDMSSMFFGSKFTQINLDGVDTSNVTNMSFMFAECSELTSLDVSGFDTSKVTNMDNMFYACYKLTGLDISGFDTKNVTSMAGMFNSCSKLTSLNLDHLVTDNVNSMWGMFGGCSGLTSLDVSKFVTSKVSDMSSMFYGCSGLSSLDLSQLDTGSVTNIKEMFSGCMNLKSLNLSGLDFSNVSSFTDVLAGCQNLQEIRTPAKLGTATIALPATFCTPEKQAILVIDENVTNTVLVPDETSTGKKRGVFGENNGLIWEYNSESKTITISGRDVVRVTTYFDQNTWKSYNGVFPMEAEYVNFSDCVIEEKMDNLFAYMEHLKAVDFSGLTTENVTSTDSMFSSCKGITTIDLQDFDTQNVTSMRGMFSFCENLVSVDLQNVDLHNVKAMASMFYGCSSLKSVKFPTREVLAVSELRSMFNGCSSLSSLDLSQFDTSGVTVDEFQYSGDVTYHGLIFFLQDCNSLTTIKAPVRMSDCSITLPATFYTADGTSTTVLSKDFAGTTLYKEGYLPENPATPLAITTQPVSAEVQDGSQATFTVSATGDGLTYRWQLCYAGDDTFRTCSFPGSDTATLTVDATKARNGYSFRCVVTDEHGSSITSDVAKLTIKADVALGVALTASKTTADSGEIVTFTAVGNGGDGNYQYKFIINDTTNDKWYKLQDYSANNTIEWTATTAGTKRIMVDIKDGTGKSVGKNVSVVVNGTVAPAELKATLTASSYEVNSGDVVTLTAQGIGGSGKYNYKFIINDKTDDKWYRLQDYGTNSVIQWTATTPGTKRLMVDVMDSNGKMFGTNITITVKAVAELSNVADENQSLQDANEANDAQSADDLENAEDAQKADEIEKADDAQEVGEDIQDTNETQNPEVDLAAEE